MVDQQTEQTPEDGCFYCGKDLSAAWFKDFFGYFFCEACYFGEVPEREQ